MIITTTIARTITRTGTRKDKDKDEEEQEREKTETRKDREGLQRNSKEMTVPYKEHTFRTV